MSSNYRNFYCFAAHAPRSLTLRVRLIKSANKNKRQKNSGRVPAPHRVTFPQGEDHILSLFLSNTPSVQVIVKDPVP